MVVVLYWEILLEKAWLCLVDCSVTPFELLLLLLLAVLLGRLTV